MPTGVGNPEISDPPARTDDTTYEHTHGNSDTQIIDDSSTEQCVFPSIAPQDYLTEFGDIYRYLETDE